MIINLKLRIFSFLAIGAFNGMLTLQIVVFVILGWLVGVGIGGGIGVTSIVTLQARCIGDYLAICLCGW